MVIGWGGCKRVDGGHGVGGRRGAGCIGYKGEWGGGTEEKDEGGGVGQGGEAVAATEGGRERSGEEEDEGKFTHMLF